MKVILKQPQAIYELGQRTNQEDNIWPKVGQATDKDFFFILCDGMGGHEHGEVASRIVSETLADYLHTHADPDTIVDDQVLLDALEAAYEQLDRADDEAVKKMGTTLCLLVFHRGGLTTLHIGDSRIYHIRPKEHKLLYQSKDHSLVYDLYQAGEITYEEMATSPQKNIITRAMQPGKDNRCKPAVVHITDLKPGDYLYICSDGMLEQMDNDSLCALFSSNKSDEAKRLELIEATQDNKDNHSAYFVAVGGVSTGEDDANLLDDEQTSKDNALNIPRILSAPDEDVEVVAQPVEETVQQGVGGDNHVQNTPVKKNNSKAVIVLGAALALALLAVCYVLSGGKKDKANDADAPNTVEIGRIKSGNDSHAVSSTPISRENRNADAEGDGREKNTGRKDRTPSKSEGKMQEKLQKAAGRGEKKASEPSKEEGIKTPSGQNEDPNSATKGGGSKPKSSKEKGLNALKEQVKEQHLSPKTDNRKSSGKPESGIPV